MLKINFLENLCVFFMSAKGCDLKSTWSSYSSCDTHLILKPFVGLQLSS